MFSVEFKVKDVQGSDKAAYAMAQVHGLKKGYDSDTKVRCRDLGKKVLLIISYNGRHGRKTSCGPKCFFFLLQDGHLVTNKNNLIFKLDLLD